MLKKKFENIPIVYKITFIYSGIFAVIFLMTSIIFMVNANYYYFATSRDELSEAAEKVSEYIKAGGEISQEAINNYNTNKLIEIKVNKMPLEQFNILPQNEGENQNIRMERINELKYMVHPKIIEYNGERYIITAARKYSSEERMLKIFTTVFVISNIIGIFTAFSIGRYISKRMLKTVVDVIHTAERISIEDLSQRIDVEGPDDEIKKLALAFNDMIGRLENSFNKQNQFISDASHELRTPISVIQGYANLIDRWGKSNQDILQESIDSIKSETEHMSMLVKKLIFLAKDEDNKKLIHKKPLLLNYTAAEVVKEFNILEISHNISLIEDDEVYIMGDYNFMKQLLWDFVENSVKYTDSKNGKIVIRIFSDGEKGCISVSDNGMGIREEDIPLVFERFYRGDKSRNKEIPGTGLGLSIAKWIIKQHNGMVDVVSKENEGTTITVSFDITKER